mmetsp:Transcript_165186/g.524849  ORF Transcript_165186/g.524849 Transcript_165186/m.524849 type:complete len:283 (-) Transcript_165186:1471-2319(-)
MQAKLGTIRPIDRRQCPLHFFFANSIVNMYSTLLPPYGIFGRLQSLPGFHLFNLLTPLLSHFFSSPLRFPTERSQSELCSRALASNFLLERNLYRTCLALQRCQVLSMLIRLLGASSEGFAEQPDPAELDPIAHVALTRLLQRLAHQALGLRLLLAQLPDRGREAQQACLGQMHCAIQLLCSALRHLHLALDAALLLDISQALSLEVRQLLTQAHLDAFDLPSGPPQLGCELLAARPSQVGHFCEFRLQHTAYFPLADLCQGISCRLMFQLRSSGSGCLACT